MPKAPAQSKAETTRRPKAAGPVVLAATMADVPEDTLNNILKGIDATNFNAVVLSRIDKTDKVVARHIQSTAMFWFGMGDDFLWSGFLTHTDKRQDALRAITYPDSKALIGYLTGQYGESKPVTTDTSILCESLVAEWLRRSSTGEAPKDINAKSLLRKIRRETAKIDALMGSLQIYQHQGHTVVSDGTNHQYLRPSPTPYHQTIFFDRATL